MNTVRVRSSALSVLVSAAVLIIAGTPADAQKARTSTEKQAPKIAVNAASYDSSMLQEFAWRPIGPAVTSGRVVDLAVAEGPDYAGRYGTLLYAAAASGGVWKSS